MFEKTCPRCGHSSYSSAADRYWICPECGLDLTVLEGRPAKPIGATAGSRTAAALLKDLGVGSPRKRLRLVDVVWQSVVDGEPHAAVRLRNAGDADHEGVAQATTPQEPVERMVAEATLRAIQSYVSALGIDLHLSVEAIEIVDHSTGPLVTVAIGLGEQASRMEFVGAALDGGAPHFAAARAVLHGLNRYLERFLGLPRGLRTAST
ncbi:MAG TPA: hypothetical protein VGK88_13285 [bacterium]|jgi:hypothetical protein